VDLKMATKEYFSTRIETKSDNPNSSSITTLQNSTTQIIFRKEI